MENQIQIKSRKADICLIMIFSIYTTIHFIITVYYSATEVNFTDIKRDKFHTLLVHCSLFISFLLTTIFLYVNFHRNICMYICLIPSLINELIFIYLLVLFIFVINFLPFNDPEIVILFVVFLFIIESCPNFILYIHICRKSNKKSENIENINNNSPLLNMN